jgi:hypothetical protein
MLEEKVSRLEQELQSERKTIQVLASGNNNTPRTCHEIHDNDPSLTSGMYWIDPDGQGVGDAPIFVYCDMSTGKKTKDKIVKCQSFELYFNMQDRP